MPRLPVTKTQFLCGTTVALRNPKQLVLVIEMQERVFESVGEVTFCLNEVPHAGRGTVNFTVRQDELSSSDFEEPGRGFRIGRHLRGNELRQPTKQGANLQTQQIFRRKATLHT